MGRYSKKSVTITTSDVAYAASGGLAAVLVNGLINMVIDKVAPAEDAENEGKRIVAKRVAIGAKVIGGGMAVKKFKDRRAKMAAIGFTTVSGLEAGIEVVKVASPEQTEKFALLSGTEDIYTHIGDVSEDTVTLNIAPGTTDTGMFKETAILGTEQEALSVL